jgi:hypothetical protein
MTQAEMKANIEAMYRLERVGSRWALRHRVSGAGWGNYKTENEAYAARERMAERYLARVAAKAAAKKEEAK